jgi:polar amino acid transport system substrate-binding protein
MAPEGRKEFMSARWTLCSLLLLLGSTLTGCAAAPSLPTAEIRHTLAPTGSLRVALYPGTPTSVLSASDRRGVGFDLGQALAQRLGVAFEPMILPKNTDVLEAVRTGRADVAFTNGSAERAQDMDFSTPYLIIQLGYLSRANGPVAALAEVDRPGVKVGVTTNSSSDAVLTKQLMHAQVVRAETVGIGVQMLASGAIDVYATNKATLFEMADKLPGARVLDGSWGAEHHAVAIPKGRNAGLPFVQAFVGDAISTGRVQSAVTRAGLRGAVVASGP